MNKYNFQLCGKWPFTTPYFFGLSVCCNGHDHAYSVLTNKVIDDYIFNKENNAGFGYSFDSYLFNWGRQFIFEVDKANLDFFCCMYWYLKEVSLVKRTLLKPVTKLFESIVRTHGYRVWKRTTLKRWEELNAKC